MPVIYSEIFWLASLFIFLLFSFALAKLLLRFTPLSRVLIVLLVVLGSCGVTFFIGFPLGAMLSNKVQVMVAQPHIQQALDKQCGTGAITADEQGFFMETIPYGNTQWTIGRALRWRSKDRLAACSYFGVNDRWECTCSTLPSDLK